ncbi:MAG: rhodanese-like domain-containing protein [Patescibacteria group bacterium]
MSLLIDVRTPEEFAERHAKGAVNIPLGDIESGEIGMLKDAPKETPLDLYCRSGGRAGVARNLLIVLGFADVKNLGGLDDL